MQIVLENVKPIDHKSVKYTFTLYFPEMKMKIYNCSWMHSDKGTWVSFPTKTYNDSANKVKYFPLVSFEPQFKTTIDSIVREQLTKLAPAPAPVQSNFNLECPF
jgi:hypothetical protein